MKHGRLCNIQIWWLLLQPFNGLFSRTTWVSRYQKSKTNLDFTAARDSEWQWHQLGHMQVCTSLQTENHANTPPLVFYRPDALPATQPTASKHWRHQIWWPSVEKVAFRLRPRATFSTSGPSYLDVGLTTVHHQYNAECVDGRQFNISECWTIHRFNIQKCWTVTWLHCWTMTWPCTYALHVSLTDER